MSRLRLLTMRLVVVATTLCSILNPIATLTDTNSSPPSDDLSDYLPVAVVISSQEICRWADAPGPAARVFETLVPTHTTDVVVQDVITSHIPSLTLSADLPPLSLIKPVSPPSSTSSVFQDQDQGSPALHLIWAYLEQVVNAYVEDILTHANVDGLYKLVSFDRISASFNWIMERYQQITSETDNAASQDSSEEWILLLLECLELLLWRPGFAYFVHKVSSFALTILWVTTTWLFCLYKIAGQFVTSRVTDFYELCSSYLSDKVNLNRFRFCALAIYHQVSDFVRLALWLGKNAPHFAREARFVALGEMAFYAKKQRRKQQCSTHATVANGVEMLDEDGATTSCISTSDELQALPSTDSRQNDAHMDLIRHSVVYNSDDPGMANNDSTDPLGSSSDEMDNGSPTELIATQSHDSPSSACIDITPPDLIDDDVSDSEASHHPDDVTDDLEPGLDSFDMGNIQEQDQSVNFLELTGHIETEAFDLGLKISTLTVPIVADDESTQDSFSECMAFFAQLTEDQSDIHGSQDGLLGTQVVEPELELPTLMDCEPASLSQDNVLETSMDIGLDASFIPGGFSLVKPRIEHGNAVLEADLSEGNDSTPEVIMPDVEPGDVESRDEVEMGDKVDALTLQGIPEGLTEDHDDSNLEKVDDDVARDDGLTSNSVASQDTRTLGTSVDHLPSLPIGHTAPIHQRARKLPSKLPHLAKLITRPNTGNDLKRNSPPLVQKKQIGTPNVVPKVLRINVNEPKVLDETLVDFDAAFHPRYRVNGRERQLDIITTLRASLRGYVFEGFKDALVTSLTEKGRFGKLMGLLQASRLDPELACTTAAFCGELAETLGNGFSTLADQAILPLLHLRGTTVSKVASESQRAITQIFQNLSSFDPNAFLPILLNLDRKVAGGTTLQGRRWILMHLRTIFLWHRARLQNGSAGINTINRIEASIRQGLADRNNGIRLIAAKCFWAYQQTWPAKGVKLRESQNQRIRSLLDGEKESSYTSDKPGIASPTMAVPDIVVNLPGEGSYQPLQEGTLWDGIVPFPYAPILGADPLSFDDEYLGPMPWVTKTDIEVEESHYLHENANDDEDDFF